MTGLKMIHTLRQELRRQELECVLEYERLAVKNRDAELKDIFGKPYQESWQRVLDEIRLEIKGLKNDYRIAFNEDFIPGQ